MSKASPAKPRAAAPAESLTLTGRFRVESVLVRNEKDLVILAPIGGEDENNFCAYVPEGRLEILVSNPDLHKQITTGNVFTLNLTRVAEKS